MQSTLIISAGNIQLRSTILYAVVLSQTFKLKAWQAGGGRVSAFIRHRIGLKHLQAAINTVTRSDFDALSIGCGLVAAVLLCMKREDISEAVFF